MDCVAQSLTWVGGIRESVGWARPIQSTPIQTSDAITFSASDTIDLVITDAVIQDSKTSKRQLGFRCLLDTH